MKKEAFIKMVTKLAEDYLTQSFEPYPRTLRDSKLKEALENLYDLLLSKG
jgi:hypothetical protein